MDFFRSIGQALGIWAPEKAPQLPGASIDGTAHQVTPRCISTHEGEHASVALPGGGSVDLNDDELMCLYDEKLNRWHNGPPAQVDMNQGEIKAGLEALRGK